MELEDVEQALKVLIVDIRLSNGHRRWYLRLTEEAPLVSNKNGQYYTI